MPQVDHVESALLFGGAAEGDFAPAWSDVDVCLVVREPGYAVTGSGNGVIGASVAP